MTWYGLALGAIVGSDGDKGTPAPESAPADDGGDFGGSRNVGEESGAQGLFSIGSHQVYGYVGGIVGWGEKVGVYVTGGPMIGWGNVDLALGGGVHFGKRFGLGLVLPVVQTVQMMSAHSEKAAYLLDKGSEITDRAGAMMASVASGGLESMLHTPAYALVGACVAGAAVAGEYIPVDGWRKRMSDGYLSLCERMRSKKKF